MENELNRILSVRKTRERSIRSRVDILRRQIETLHRTIAAAEEQRHRVRVQWDDARTLRGVVDYCQLQLHSQLLSEIYARDAAIQMDLDAHHQQLAALEQDLNATLTELRDNLVGQEKLASLVDSETTRSSHGGGLL